MSKATIAFLLNILFFICSPSVAQYFWNTVDDYQYHSKSEYKSHLLIMDSVLLVGGYVNTQACYTQAISAYQLTGDFLWRSNGYFDAITSSGEFLYGAGNDYGHDDVFGDERIVISKYTIDGEELISETYPEVMFDHGFEEFIPNHMTVVKSGDLLLTSRNRVIRANEMCQFISEKYFELAHDIISINQFSANDYLLSTEGGLFRCDSAYTFSDSLNFDGKHIKSLVNDDTIYSLLEDKLLRLHSSLEIIDTLMVTDHMTFDDLLIKGEQIMIGGFHLEEDLIIRLKDAGIQDTLHFEKLMNTKGFLNAESRYFFLGDSFSEQIGMTGYNVQEGSYPIQVPDIEIVDFGMDMTKIHYYEDWQGNKYPYYFNFDSEFTVRNAGMDTIRELSVYYDLYGGFNCAQFSHYECFTELALPPGQETTLIATHLSQEFTGGGTSSICIELMAPNSGHELETTNNTMCKTFVYTDVVENENEINDYVHIYPNPAEYQITFELNSSLNPGSQLTIYDNLGREMESQVMNSDQVILNVNEYEPGIYFYGILVDEDKTGYWGRFIKQ